VESRINKINTNNQVRVATKHEIMNARHKEIIPEGTEAFQQFINTELKLFQARMFCAVALGIGSSFSLAVAAEDPAGPALTKTVWP
jgi:hypothetical protein